MRALTLHQPWASLIARCVKTIETRSWAPPRSLISQMLAIHAGRKVHPNLGPVIDAILRQTHGEQWQRQLPAGAVVATATISCTCQVAGHAADTGQVTTGCRQIIATDPYADFSAGRWLWFLADISSFPDPIPATGWKHLWYWEPPAG